MSTRARSGTGQRRRRVAPVRPRLMRALCLTLAVIMAAAGHLPAVVMAQDGPPELLPRAQAARPQEIELEGDAEVLYEDYATGGILRYFLNSNGRRRELRFTGDPPGLNTGDRIRVRGVPQPDGTLQLSGSSSATTLTPAQAAALGPQSTIVILVNFTGNPVQPYTPNQAQTVMTQVSDHYWQGSYQQTTVAATVAGWFTVSSTGTVCDTTQIAYLADQAATNAGVNLSAYARRVYAFPQIAACTWWGLATVGGAPSKAWVNGAFALKVVGHEMGHNLGLYHAKALECGTVTLGPACSSIEYGNTIDIMGNPSSADFNLVAKERIGWINAGVSPLLTTVTASGTYFIPPYESFDGNAKGLKILKSTDPTTGFKTYYYVEFRQPIGNDAFLTANANVKSGVVIATGSESTGNSNLLLDMTPETASWSDPALVAGRTFTDPDTGLTLQTLTADASGATVIATLPVVPPAAPTATVTLNTATPGTNDVLRATATAADANNDPVTLTYVWKVNGVTVRTTAGSPSLTDALDLSEAGHGDAGDTVAVEVTPNDGTLTGATVSSTATVQPLPTHNVNFAATGLGSGMTLSVAYTRTEPSGLLSSGSQSFTPPGPGANLAAGAGTLFTYAFPATATKGATTYFLVSAAPASGFTAGAGGGTTTVTATYSTAPVNTPPTATVSLNTATPGTNATLTATATKADVDGDVVTLTYVWKVNGATKKTTAGSASLTDTFDLSVAGNGGRGDTVIVEVTPGDGTASGATVSAAATVQNTAPSATVTLDTAAPGTNATLTATAAKTDMDADVVTLTYIWKVNGVTRKTTAGSASLTDTFDLSVAGNGSSGDTVIAEVTPSDGTASGAVASAMATVENTVPTATVSLNTATPGTNATLTATATKSDVDGDVVTLTYVWKVNGVTRKTTAGSASLTDMFDLSVAGNGSAGDTVIVEVTPNDGTASGALVSATATVQNTVPTATVSLNTATPATNATLTATATKVDADTGDVVTLTYVWKVNGLTQKTTAGFASLTDTFDLSVAGNGSRGDTITVQVTPADGTVSGSMVAAFATVQNSAPSLTPPGDQVSAEGAVVSVTLMASDPDNDVLSYGAIGLPAGLTTNAATGLISGTLGYEVAGTHPVTVTVTDGALPATTAFTWTVTNTNRAPVVSAVPNRTDAEGQGVSLAVAASDPDGDALTYTAAGLPGGVTINAGTGAISGTIDYDAAGPHAVTVTASDGSLSALTNFTWTVTPTNRAPILTVLPNRSDAEAAAINLPVVASDPDGDGLTYSATGLPDGLAMNAATGLIAGTLTYSAAGTHGVTVTASDDALSVETSFVWTVTQTNRAPVVAALTNHTDAEAASIHVAVEASDPDDDALTYGASGLPNGLAMDAATGVIAGALSYDAAGTYAVTVTVSDGSLSAATSFTWIVEDVNRAPVVTALADRTDAEADTVNVAVAASDPDDDSLTYSATGLPDGVAIDTATGLITGALGYGTAGTYGVAVTVGDGTLSAGISFDWTVTHTNRAPVVTALTDRTDAEAVSIHVAVEASDPDGDALTYGASGLPNGLAMDAATGMISGALSYDAAATYAVTVTVSDGSLSAATSFTWIVEDVNRAPVVTAVTDRIDAEGQSVSLAVAANDPDGDALSYTAAGVPAGLTIDAATGSISGALTYDAAGVHDVTVSVSDGSLSATANFAWTVLQTNRSPVIAALADRTDVEGASIALPVVGSDPDGDALAFSAAGLPAGLTIDPASGVIGGTLTSDAAGAHAVTVTVHDGALSAATSFTWTVTSPNRAPVVAPLPDRTDAEATTTSLVVVASDPDEDSLVYSATGLPEGVALDSATGTITGTFGYNAAGTHAVTITVSDGALSGATSFTWTITETNRQPVVTPLPDRADAEGAAISFAVTASDPDGDVLIYAATGLPADLSINAETGVIGGTLGYDTAGAHGVTITVSDGTVSASASFTWTIAGTNRAPVIAALADRTDAEASAVTLAVVGSDPDADTLSYGATGLPDGVAIDPATGVIGGTLSYAAAGTHSVTVTVSDGALIAATTFTWTVTNANRAPVVTALPPRTDAEGSAISLAVVASDPDGDSLTFSAAGLPPGLTLDSATGLITGTLSYGTAGTYEVSVTLGDGTLTAATSFTWTVTHTNRAPVVTALADRTDAEGNTVSFATAASDPDGDELTYSATGLPDGLAIDPATGLLAGTLTYNAAGAHAVTVTASDGTLSVETSFVWTVTETNRVPVVASLPDRLDAEADTVSVAVAASDPDADSLTYGASGLPPGVAIDAATGVIVGILSYDASGAHAVTVTVSDGTLSAETHFTWTVSETNRAPVVSALADRTDAEAAAISLAVVGHDPDDDPLTYSGTGLPAGLTLDASNGLITGAPGYDTAGTYAVTVTVDDGTLSAATSFTWTVTHTNRAPVVAAVTDRADAEGAGVTLALVGSDPDADTLSYSATGLPDGVAIDPATGVIGGTLSYAAAGAHAITVTVSDGALIDATTFTWTVTNTNRAPVVTALPARTDAEGSAISLPVVASDPDGDALTFSAAGLPAGLTIDPASGVISGTLTYDAAGTTVVTVTVRDSATLDGQTTFTWTVTATNRAPVLTAPGAQASAEGMTVLLAVVASDPDGDTLAYSAAGLPPGVTINGSTGVISGTLSYTSAGSRTVTISVYDGALTTSRAFVWNVTNVNRAPTATVILNTATPRTADLLTATATASDPDGDPVMLQYTWKVNGSLRRTTVTSALIDTFDLSLTANGDKGQTITVTVTPGDGIAPGVPVSAAATVQNTLPTATVTLSTSAPSTTAVLTATATRADPDLELVTLTYVWKVNGIVRRTVASTSLTDMFDLGGTGNGDTGDAITVTVTPADSTGSGSSASAGATVH